MGHVLRGKGHEAGVAVVEEDVGEDHEAIEGVEHYDDIHFEEEFMEDAGEIADEDDIEEADAFTGIGAGAPGFEECNGPGSAEADEHDHFKDAEVGHGERSISN